MQRFNPVRERKKGVGGGDTIGEIVVHLCRLGNRDLGRVDPAHLAGANADDAILHTDHDAVGANVLDDSPCQLEGTQLVFVRCPFGHDLPFLALPTRVRPLNQETAVDIAHHQAAAGCGLGLEHPQVLFSRKDVARGIVVARSDHHLGKLLHDHLSERTAHLLICCYDTTESRHRVGRARLAKGLSHIVVETHSAGVGVLDHRNPGAREVPHQSPGPGGISQVVVRKCFPLDLTRTGETRRGFAPCEHPPLMRILTVAKLDLVAAEKCLRHLRSRIRPLLAHQARQVSCDDRIVGRGVAEGLDCHAAPEIVARFTRRELGENLGVVHWIHHHRHPCVIFGSRPNEARAADVDLLDSFLEVGIVTSHRFTEWVEIDNHEVDIRDLQL